VDDEELDKYENLLRAAVETVLDFEGAEPRIVGEVVLVYTYHDGSDEHRALDSVGTDNAVLGLATWAQGYLKRLMLDE
jgi:hypothetical protein